MPTLTDVPDDTDLDQADQVGDQEPDYESLIPGGDMLDLDAFTAPEIEEMFHLSQEVKNKHKSPPKGKPTSRGQYADPANYKWPIDAKHIRAAVSYFNHGNKSGYNSSMWATIGRRIAAAANRLIGSGHSFSNGSIATAGSEEYRLALDIIPTDLRVVAEETIVNGVPCFSFEAMVIPGDAISKNTIPGKRGPTYYSARRVRQYAADNNRIIEELASKGQKVTVYPRHAAALLDASLPMGWVDKYDVRPSKTRPGMEDVWYTATVPLTTEGRDAWMKLRTGLVKYSSLRTFPDNRFTTQPCKVDGRVVEEATSLPIAGIDLVATQPGLPVEPIRILEEAAHPVALEEPMTAPAVPPHAAAVQPPMPAQQNQPQGQQPGAPTPAAGSPQVPPQYSTCPNCGGDITHHILAAHAQMSKQQPPQQQQQPGQGQGQPGQGAQQPAQGGQPPMRGAREEALESENAELKQRLAALTAAQEGTPVSDKQTTPAVEGDGSNAEIAALRAQIAALQAENAASKTALEEATALVKSVAAQKAVNAKINELVASDKTMGTLMRPIIARAVEEAEISDPVLVQIKYWELRSQQTELLASRSAQAASFPGFGHVNVAGLEELGTSATGTAGQNSTDQGDKPAAKPRFSGFEAELRSMFGRTGDVAPTTWDRAARQ